MNNAEGGKNMRQTMIQKYGSEEAWREFMRSIGTIGGKNGTGHVFGHGKVDPRVIGAKGGRISRRRPKKAVDGQL
jgi:general stress protein YciG